MDGEQEEKIVALRLSDSPKADGEFVAKMEEVPDIYGLPYDPNIPVAATCNAGQKGVRRQFTAENA